MFGDIAQFLLNILATLYGAVLLLRLWLQFVRMPPYNPISRTVFQFTDWIVVPLRRVIGGRGGIDWACVVAAWVTALVYLAAVMMVDGINPTSLFPEALWIALLLLLKWGINLVMWVTLLMVILSWVNPRAPAMPALHALTAPLLDPIRRMLPAMGGLDLSPLVLFLITQIALMVLSRIGLPVFGL
ncbi:YggT family protein [Pigmentiphaga sp.]|jgi:Predicted integral membrane protein|uniref:YggT family protein n=1 Tax=Pigmentiphaga sp. TaxID=1977564 RepID=UPI0025DA3223|nr:YggT family protein [Pigmentiphaga sp.]MBX6319593.1 YggT family protein [Pigmentiphaga sp.]